MATRTQRRTTLMGSSRSSTLDLAPDAAWAVVASGREGRQWYVDAAPFVVRGGLDRLLGGSGRDAAPPGRALLRTGDRAGFWLVRACADHRLVLDAEVRAPGRVTLVSEVHPAPDGGSRVVQEVTFSPSGLLGATYLLADLPARETVIELVHRRLLGDLARAPRP